MYLSVHGVSKRQNLNEQFACRRFALFLLFQVSSHDLDNLIVRRTTYVLKCTKTTDVFFMCINVRYVVQKHSLLSKGNIYICILL